MASAAANGEAAPAPAVSDIDVLSYDLSGLLIKEEYVLSISRDY